MKQKRHIGIYIIIAAVILLITAALIFLLHGSGEPSATAELNGSELSVRVANVPRYLPSVTLTLWSAEGGTDDLVNYKVSSFLKGEAVFFVDLRSVLRHAGEVFYEIRCGVDVPTISGQIWCGVWFDSVVVHAGGEIDGHTTTNSAEAFLNAYEKGFRSFEADIQLTSDDIPVLRHYWFDDTQPDIAYTFPSYEEFINAPVFGKLTPMTLEDLFVFMSEHEDFWLITDTKYGDYENASAVFHKIVEAAQDLGCPEVLDRIVVQLYNENMYNAVNDVYPFRNYIFTMYQRWDTGNGIDDYNGILVWSVQHGVNTIVMREEIATDEIIELTASYGLDICFHTVNESARAEELFGKGAGIMTDAITPYEAAELYRN